MALSIIKGWDVMETMKDANNNHQSDVVYLTSDHAGMDLRARVSAHLTHSGYKVMDLGPKQGEPVDDPDYGEKLPAALTAAPDARGWPVWACGTGTPVARD